MKLSADYVIAENRSFDNVIGRNGQNGHARRKTFQRLTVRGVYPCFVAENFAFTGNGVENIALAHMSAYALKRAAQKHVDKLKTAANAEYRQVFAGKIRGYVEFEFVFNEIDVVRRNISAVVSGQNVPAADKQKSLINSGIFGRKRTIEREIHAGQGVKISFRRIFCGYEYFGIRRIVHMVFVHTVLYRKHTKKVNNHMKKIGMVVALEKELKAFLEKQTVEIKEEKSGAFSVIEFTLGKNEVICVKSGVGEIFAAAATQYLITAYKPDIIINFGVCGSLTKSLGLEKVALIKGVVHYAFDTSAVDNVEAGRYEQFDDVVIKTDENLLAKAMKAAGEDLPCVICASADKFVADQDEKTYLKNTFGASVCEMESAGVLITCRNAGVPCLIIKAVSDGEGGAEDYEKTVRIACGKYVKLVSALCNGL